MSPVSAGNLAAAKMPVASAPDRSTAEELNRPTELEWISPVPKRLKEILPFEATVKVEALELEATTKTGVDDPLGPSTTKLPIGVVRPTNSLMRHFVLARRNDERRVGAADDDSCIRLHFTNRFRNLHGCGELRRCRGNAEVSCH